jgi:predicted metallopeptidase
MLAASATGGIAEARLFWWNASTMAHQSRTDRPGEGRRITVPPHGGTIAVPPESGTIIGVAHPWPPRRSAIGWVQGRISTMLRRAAVPHAPRAPFDFTAAMWMLCDDITSRLDELLHIDMSRVAVSYAQTRSRAMHGLQAKLTPMRFERGSTTTNRRGRTYACQRLMLGGREMLYILTFYLPRFLDQSFSEKMITVLHELFHISPAFDGDIRRFEGRYHVHSHSQKEYDREMDRLARHYVSLKPPRELYEWLQHDFRTLHAACGGVRGLQVPVPKLIPLQKSA